MTRSAVIIGTHSLPYHPRSSQAPRYAIWPGVTTMRLLESPELFLAYDVLYVWDDVYELLEWWMERHRTYERRQPHPFAVLMAEQVIRPLRVPVGPDPEVDEYFAYVLALAIEGTHGVMRPDVNADIAGVLFELENARRARRSAVLPGEPAQLAPYLAIVDERAAVSEALETTLQYLREGKDIYAKLHSNVHLDDFAVRLESAAPTFRRRYGAPDKHVDEAFSLIAPDFHFDGFNASGGTPLQVDEVLDYRRLYGNCLTEMRSVAAEALRTARDASQDSVAEAVRIIFEARKAMVEEILLQAFPWTRRVHRGLSSPLTALAVDGSAFAVALATNLPISVPGLGMVPSMAASRVKRRAARRGRPGSGTAVDVRWYLEWISMSEDLEQRASLDVYDIARFDDV